jgi:hypothetical protein
VKKGIVMEIDGRFLTLLTPEGEFLKARKEKHDYLIGQEIDFFPINQVTKKNKSMFYHFPGKVAAAAVLAIMVGVASFLPIYNNNEVYAYMSIDVNPSIELAVNADLKVVDLKGYNVEGKQIISKIKEWKHEKVSTVTSTIIEEIKNQGFFENHDKVVISAVYDDNKKPKVEEKLEANIEKIEDEIEKDNLQLTVVHGTKKERKKAVEQGVTTGVYKEKQSKIEIKEEKTDQKTENIKSDDKQVDKIDSNKTTKKAEDLKNDDHKKEINPKNEDKINKDHSNQEKPFKGKEKKNNGQEREKKYKNQQRSNGDDDNNRDNNKNKRDNDQDKENRNNGRNDHKNNDKNKNKDRDND